MVLLVAVEIVEALVHLVVMYNLVVVEVGCVKLEDIHHLLPYNEAEEPHHDAALLVAA